MDSALPYAREGRMGRKLAKREQRIRDLEKLLDHIAKTTNDPVAAKQARAALGGEDDE